VPRALTFAEWYSPAGIIEFGARGPRIRGHHTTLRNEGKKRKVPVARNMGVIGAGVAVLSGGEVIEREGKRKHWRRLEDGGDESGEDEEGITDRGMLVVDEDGKMEALPEGDIVMTKDDEEGI
jgi:hypothetical protein